jgi:prepilin-type N-terminal cleavage/methylation domain-containing protein
MLFSHRHQAFTLLEVLVVIAIMSIVAISAFSSIINLQKTARVNETHQRFTNFLNLARSYALDGKLVSGVASGCDTGSCLPKYFGARIDQNSPDGSCDNQSSRAVIFYAPITLLSYEKSKTVTLDSFCINSRVTPLIETAGLGTISDVAFLYEPPLGAFSTSKNVGSASEIAISFCDLPQSSTNASSGCSQSSYKKTITLYANAGIPE